eukprot:5284915-Alexandrium_andersonii.AAC.1
MNILFGAATLGLALHPTARHLAPAGSWPCETLRRNESCDQHPFLWSFGRAQGCGPPDLCDLP